MLCHISQGFRINAAEYFEVLETVVKLWEDEVNSKKPCVLRRLSTFTKDPHNTRIHINNYDHVTSYW